MFKLLVNKTRIHKVNGVCLGSVLFTQTGRIQNFPSAASLEEIIFFETEQSGTNLAPFTFPKLNS